MCPATNKRLQAVVSSCRNTSLPVRVLDPKQVEEHFDGRFHLPEDWVGVVTEFSGVIKATKVVSMFQSLALNMARLSETTWRLTAWRETIGRVASPSPHKAEISSWAGPARAIMRP
ncbi:unnamed protein product [Cuscuta europaea]|uniref:Uncharacterized protein n=1 Tax=Cuscuta europaea TaxID=41803 RepID=A0A9P1EGW6_CUSEU|nr:unnamed protein product [Cuscuta europaea]